MVITIPNMATANLHIHIPKPHIEIPKPHIEIPKPHIEIPSPKEIIGDICEKVGHEEECLKHVKRPLCIDKILAIPGCFQDIHKIANHHPATISVSCCNTILGVAANACLNLILPGIPNIVGLVLSETCNQVYKNTPPPPAKLPTQAVVVAPPVAVSPPVVIPPQGVVSPPAL